MSERILAKFAKHNWILHRENILHFTLLILEFVRKMINNENYRVDLNHLTVPKIRQFIEIGK